MARIGLLHGIRREKSNRIDCTKLKVVGHIFPVEMRCPHFTIAASGI
jgi:hypothetical protein